MYIYIYVYIHTPLCNIPIIYNIIHMQHDLTLHVRTIHTIGNTQQNRHTRKNKLGDNDCFYYHSWRNNVVIAFGTLSSCTCPMRACKSV